MTGLETILLAYSIMLAVVAIIQTIRLALVRDELAERDATVAILRTRPTCAACSAPERRAA